MADIEYDFKDYMITLGIESVILETEKFNLALQKLMTEKAQEILKKKTGNSENDALVLMLQQDPEWQETIDDNTLEF